MTHHTELINLIAEKIGAKTYLEIGVHNPDHNFNHVNIRNRISVDPDPEAKAMHQVTSDDFFRYWDMNWEKIDMIFIDGLHHADQVKRDIQNAWNILKNGGVIILHDCNPPTEATTCVPRGAQREWCGDVYKTVCLIGNKKFTVDMDYGCMVLVKEDEKLWWINDTISWMRFADYRPHLLHLVTPAFAKDLIEKFSKINNYVNI